MKQQTFTSRICADVPVREDAAPTGQHNDGETWYGAHGAKSGHALRAPHRGHCAIQSAQLLLEGQPRDEVYGALRKALGRVAERQSVAGCLVGLARVPIGKAVGRPERKSEKNQWQKFLDT